MKNIQLEKLKEPIPPKWRVQSSIKGQGDVITNVIMVSYIDARDVQDRLDKVCGIGGWQNDFYEIKGKQFCRIGIKIDGEWVWKSDNGTASKTETEKGETSDAFKRAAVHWGINRIGYKYSTVKLPAKLYGKNPFPVNERGEFLKGQKLFDVCNKMAKVDEFSELYETELEEKMNQAKAYDHNSEVERVQEFIEKSKTHKELETVRPHLRTSEQIDLFEARKNELVA